MTNALQNVTWYTSDLPDNLEQINAFLAANGNDQVIRPVALEAATLHHFQEPVDVIFTANTCHIMAWQDVKRLCVNAGRCLSPGAMLVIYGPFHVGGRATSEGNYRFDLTLSQSNPWQGIRHREALIQTADQAGFSLLRIDVMPANNQLLVLSRRRDLS